MGITLHKTLSTNHMALKRKEDCLTSYTYMLGKNVLTENPALLPQSVLSQSTTNRAHSTCDTLYMISIDKNYVKHFV